MINYENNQKLIQENISEPGQCTDQAADMFSVRLLAWYEREKRDLPWRHTKDPYKIWVSEVMLQQTQVKTVIPYYKAFLEIFPTLEALALAELDEVYRVWRGLGYYSRARRLWEGANDILSREKGVMPADFAGLIKVPGIGEYTAGAVASIAFNQKVPAIDGNVKRVFSRLLAWEEKIESAKTVLVFKEQIGVWQPETHPGDFNQALMELGARICVPRNPRCAECPVGELCQAYAQGSVPRFPVKKERTVQSVVQRVIFVMTRNGEVYLQKRPDKGLLAGLWEFPGVDVSGEALEELLTGGKGLKSLKSLIGLYEKSVKDRQYRDRAEQALARNSELRGPVDYVFSHRKWQMFWIRIDIGEEGFLADKSGTELAVVKEDSQGYGTLEQAGAAWVGIDRLKDVALPTAFMEIGERLMADF